MDGREYNYLTDQWKFFFSLEFSGQNDQFIL